MLRRGDLWGLRCPIHCQGASLRLRLDFCWQLDLGWLWPSTSPSILLQGFNKSSAKEVILPSLNRKVRQGCLCMGTPASDPDPVTQLSFDFEGLRISITRGRVPSAVAAPASSEASARALAPSEASSGSAASFSVVGGDGSVALFAHLLSSARSSRSAVATPEFRANRAWTAGLWAVAVLDKRVVTPSCAPPLQLPSRVSRLQRRPRHYEPGTYLRLVDNHRGLSLSHGWPGFT